MRRALIVLLVVLGVPQLAYGLWIASREPSDGRGLAVGGLLMLGWAAYLWKDAKKARSLDDESGDEPTDEPDQQFPHTTLDT